MDGLQAIERPNTALEPTRWAFSVYHLGLLVGGSRRSRGSAFGRR